MHEGNLFWFWALICESLTASLTGASKEQDGNSGELDFVFPVAEGGFGGFTWQRGSGTQGGESLLWHNHLRPHGSGWVSCHSNRHGNYPPDFLFWLFRVQHCEVWEILVPMCFNQEQGSFCTYYPWGLIFKNPIFQAVAGGSLRKQIYLNDDTLDRAAHTMSDKWGHIFVEWSESKDFP